MLQLLHCLLRRFPNQRINKQLLHCLLQLAINCLLQLLHCLLLPQLAKLTQPQLLHPLPRTLNEKERSLLLHMLLLRRKRKVLLLNTKALLKVVRPPHCYRR